MCRGEYSLKKLQRSYENDSRRLFENSLRECVAILRTCKHLHQVAESILYHTNTFTFINSSKMKEFFLRSTAFQLASMRRLYLNIDIRCSERKPKVDDLFFMYEDIVCLTNKIVRPLESLKGLQVLSLGLSVIIIDIQHLHIPATAIPVVEGLKAIKGLRNFREFHIWLLPVMAFTL